MIKKQINIILDIGKTNVKLVLISQQGKILKEIRTKQTLRKYKNRIIYLNS